MSNPYKNYPDQESNENSDVDIQEENKNYYPSINSPHPQLATPQNFQGTYRPNLQQNILHGPGYKLVQAKEQVSKWSGYLKIFAYILIVLGWIKTIGGIISLFVSNHTEFEIESSKGKKEILHLNDGLILFASLLDILRGIITLLIGYKCLNEARDPSRYGSWNLFKRTFTYAILYLVVLTIVYVLCFIAFAETLGKWIEEADIEDGEYYIKHKQTGHNFTVNKQNSHRQRGHGQSEEFDERVGITVIVMGVMLTMFCMWCCCVTMCCGCILGGIYKYHVTTKELDIIQDLPSIRGMNVQGVQMPNMQYHPNISVGQVIRVPVNN